MRACIPFFGEGPAAAGVLLLCCFVASPAVAGEPARSFKSLSDAERQELDGYVQAGLKAYDRRNFEESISKFEQALEILRHPDFIYRIALAYERLGRNRKALEHYRRFLKLAPDTDDRPEVERTIRRLSKKIARQKPTIEVRTDPAGATVRIDEEEAPLGKTALDARVEPGTHTLTVSKSGYETIEREIALDQGESLSVEYDLEPATDAAGERSRTGPFLLLGGGGLAAVGSAASYVQFANFRRTVRQQKACMPECQKPETFDSNVRSQKLYERLAWGSGAVAAAAATGGALWLALYSDASESRTRSDLSFTLTPRVSANFVGLECALRPRGW